MKFNRKMKIILGVCLLIAAFSTFMLYNALKSKIEPVVEVEVPVFKHSLIQDTEITANDIMTISIKENLIPKDALLDSSQFVGKRLMDNVHSGEFIFLNRLSERGVVRLENDDMYIIGIDIENISDYMGLQLKIGDKYHLYSKFPGVDPEKLADITILTLVDVSGREVSESYDSNIKTINVAVENEEDMKKIIVAEFNRAIEIVKPPVKD